MPLNVPQTFKIPLFTSQLTLNIVDHCTVIMVTYVNTWHIVYVYILVVNMLCKKNTLRLLLFAGINFKVLCRKNINIVQTYVLDILCRHVVNESCA